MKRHFWPFFLTLFFLSFRWCLEKRKREVFEYLQSQSLSLSSSSSSQTFYQITRKNRINSSNQILQLVRSHINHVVCLSFQVYNHRRYRSFFQFWLILLLIYICKYLFFLSNDFLFAPFYNVFVLVFMDLEWSGRFYLNGGCCNDYAYDWIYAIMRIAAFQFFFLNFVLFLFYLII